MALTPRTQSEEHVAGDQTSSTKDSLEELRGLLFEPEQAKLDSIKERLENPIIRAQEISRILPDAIAHRIKQDSKVSQVLTPVIEESFTHSIRKRPQVIVDIIAPIMGPAIRKAISRAFRSMVQSMNQVLEQSLSWRGLTWRFEAWRTGKPFAEIVLLHTLRFRVEQVFLIHKHSGLLIQHAAADSVVIQDESMISAMLSAIQSFIHDSFPIKQDSSLDLLHVGELTVLIEQSRDALLAGVIRGAPPFSLRTLFQETLETIQIQFGSALAEFQGNTMPFESVRTNLEDCLQSQFADKKPPSLLPLWIFLIVVIVFAFSWWYPLYRDQQLWANYINRLKEEPGLVITDHTENGKFFIAGLRDAQAADPDVLLKQNGLHPDRVRTRWEPYFSLHPTILERRVVKFLKPPQTVQLTITEGVLAVKGIASTKWRNTSRQMALRIPGILSYRDKEIKVRERVQLEQFKQDLEEQHIFFDQGSAALTRESLMMIQGIGERIQDALTISLLTEDSIQIEIHGYTDSTGPAALNRRLSTNRATAVRTALLDQGIPEDIFSIYGEGAFHSPLSPAIHQDKEKNRRVSFHIKFFPRT